MAIRNLVKETTINSRMTKVVRYTKFKNNPHGDGGSKRSVQIEEYWKKQSIQFIEEEIFKMASYKVVYTFDNIYYKVCWVEAISNDKS